MTPSLDTLVAQGWQARRDRRPGDARQLFAEAVELARTDGGPLLGRALVGLGQIERDLGDLGPAREHYEEALSIMRAEGHALKVAHTVRHLGDICYEDGRSDLAETHFQEALAIYRADPGAGRLDLANAIRSMALLKETRGDSEEAAQLWQEARDLYEVVNVQEGVAESSARLARLERRRAGT